MLRELRIRGRKQAERKRVEEAKAKQAEQEQAAEQADSAARARQHFGK